MLYRREIDGLRALAVVPVILFHAGIDVFSGGFVGVDIFFVISGYLITSIIIGEQEKGRFSILKFYERRARRIMPVLFFVLLCCLPFAWAWMLPMQMKDFGHSIIAVCLFVSNFLFWKETGYFAAAAEEQPLLHTWSLAVEEQYYLVFPLFVMFCWRFGRKTLVAIIAIVAILSLLLADYGSVHFASANFYLPTTRAWELLAGSLTAFILSGRTQKPNEILSLTGLALILFSIVAYDELTPFPSFYALPPVIGTALIILFAAQGTLVARILSTAPMVGIGLISYSAYLWHQPLFAFARIRSLTEPSTALFLTLSVTSLVLAYFSWRFVETPFRTGRITMLSSAPRVLTATAIGTGLFIAIGFVGSRDNGLQFRLPQTARTVLAEKANHDPAMDTCLFDKGESNIEHPVRACLTAHSTSSKTILIGDSHAGAIAGEALREFDKAKVDLYAMSHSACLGFSGFYVSDPKYRLRCNSFFSGIENYIRDSGVDTVIMLDRWSLYIDGGGFDNGEGGVEALTPIYADLLENESEAAGRFDDARKARVLERYLQDIKKYLDGGTKVVLVYPIPEAGWNVPDLVAKAAMAGETDPIFSTSAELYRKRNATVLAAFDALSHPNLYRVKPAEFFCGTIVKDRCLNNQGYEKIYYIDSNHPSNAGAALVVPAILKAVEASRADTSADKLATSTETP
ncbi:acyltransferase family protein [Rhizobium sp. 32-5/1]|uniref:acyltransferase family protein n=1 Tax=Rhizobium sp. 32-5/1 TaxID=3019602 RepID=UPI00240D8D5E|nr:acyltransferase family protein [Rhizobium sp. 32-5/1]WEZ83167.1 acyltransferase family protein [Rhizobium sp. 32-5/1]